MNVPELADTTFAMDFLLRAKEGVRNTAVALPKPHHLILEQFYEDNYRKGLLCIRK